MENLVQQENFNSLKDCVFGFDIDDTLTDNRQYEYDKLQEFLTDVIQLGPYTGQVKNEESTLGLRYPGLDSIVLHKFNDWFFPQMVKEAPFRPHIQELFEKLHNEGAKCYIVTRRDDHYIKSKYTGAMMRQDTEERLESNHIQYDKIFYGCSNKKETMKENNIHILIDDSPMNIFQVATSYPVIIMDNPYNRNMDGKNMYRIHSLEPNEFFSVLERINKDLKESFSQ